MLNEWINALDKAVGVSADNPLPIAPAAGAVLPVGGQKALLAATFARPADTTAYAALDVVGAGALITFAGAGRVAAGSGLIVKARLMVAQAACTARHRLHLYHTAPAVIADNAPLAMLWANRAGRIGYIDFPALATEGTGSDCAGALAPWDRLAYACAAGDTAIYGVLETLDAYTPGNAAAYFLELTVERD
jgi:hypothetical protein